jgi:endoglucanase
VESRKSHTSFATAHSLCLTCLATAILLLASLLGTSPAGAARTGSQGGCPRTATVKALLKRTQATLARASRGAHPAPAEVRGRLRRRVARLRDELRCAPASPSAAHHEPGGSEAVSEGSVKPKRAPDPGSKAPQSEPSSPEPPGSEPPASEPAAAPLSIAVAGNRLVDGSGNTVVLHGVNLSGTMWSCLGGKAFASPIDEAALASMVAWHVNAVRIPMNEDCWLGINGAPTDVDKYHGEIKRFVERLHALGVYAILDLHWSAPGTTLSHLGSGYEGFFEMADADHSPAFWESLASYFRGDGAVLFDLYNEPFGISWACLRNGCLVPREYQAAGMQQLVDAVRRAGATQPVLVAGLNSASLAGEEWLRHRPEDPAHQLGASIHAYGVLGGYAKNIGVVAQQVPVVLTEVGEKDCAHEALDRILPWADSNGVSYLAWAWYTGDCYKGPALITDYSGAPTPYGVGYRDHLVHTFPAPSPPPTG